MDPTSRSPLNPDFSSDGRGAGGRLSSSSRLGSFPADDQDGAQPSRPEPSRWFGLAVVGLALALGLFAVGRHWNPDKWLFGDGAFYMNVVRGVLEHGSLRQEAMHPHSWYDQDLGWNGTVDAAWSNIALGRNGEWWPKHPILMPLVAAPFVWAFGPIGSLVFQFVSFLAMAFLAWRVASRVASRPAALAAAAAFVATPWIFDRVWGFNNDVFYSVLILAAVDAALARKAVLAGALLGIGVFAKATNVLYGPALLLLFVLRKDWRGTLRFCVAAAIPALVYLGLNTYMFGSPLRTGYDRILVRTNGVLGMHSHATDFHFANLRPALERVLMGGEGFAAHFPLLFPALLGLGVLALRRGWREAITFAWCIAVPIAFHAPYTWYRLEFNLPQTALAVAPLAALLPPFAGPSGEVPGRSRVRWGRTLGVLAVVVLLVAGFGRSALPSSHGYFWRELPHASVHLGDYPCDYFNNQVERWECSHYDNNDWLMTGRVLTKDLRFHGVPEDLVLLHPHATGKERRIDYANVPLTSQLDLRYGLADSSRTGARVQFKVLVDDTPVLEEEVADRGLVAKPIDTSAWAGTRAKVSFIVTAAEPSWSHFAFDGGPRK